MTMQHIDALARKCKARVILGIGLLLCAPCLAQRQAVGPKTTPSPETPMGIPLRVPPGAWLTHRWTASDAPYARIEQEVSHAIQAGRKPASVLAEARQNAVTHPLDFQAQFAWLYASTMAATELGMVDWHAMEAVEIADPGNVRQVARIRFAAGVLGGQNGYHPDLDGIGERLLATDPKDDWVREHLIYDLCNGRKAMPRALTLATDWVRRKPGSAKAHAVMAFTYEAQWLWSRKKDKQAASNTIAEYQAYIRLAPPGDAFSKDVTRLIKTIGEMAASAH